MSMIELKRVGERRLTWPDRICYLIIFAGLIVLVWRVMSQKSENGTNDMRIDGRANAAMLELLRNLVSSSGSQKLLETSEKRKPEVPLHHRVYLTVREAAAYAGRPERHIRALIQNGELPANTSGHTRVRRRDLDGL